MTLYKNVNGIDIPLTPDEEQEHLQREVDFENSRLERLKKLHVDALIELIDKKAQEKEYKDALSCVSYSNSTNPQWAAESQAFLAWRDVVYEYGYEYLEGVQSGSIENPTIEGFIAGTPALTWPEVATL